MFPRNRWFFIAVLAVAELWIAGAMLALLVRPHGGRGPSFSFGASADASTPAAAVDTTLAVGMGPTVVIDDDGTDYTVRTAPGGTVRVKEILESRGMSHVALAQLAVEKTSDGVRIARPHAPMRMWTFGIGSTRHEVEVTVPPGAALAVENVGAFTGIGLARPLHVHSDNGRITLTDTTSSAQLETSNGRIEVIRGSFSTLEARTDNGRITLADVNAVHVRLHTENGRIEGSNLRVDGGGSIETSNGRIALGFDPASSVVITAHTSSGKVRAVAPLSASAGGDEDADDQPHIITVGGGTGRLTVSSDNGSITISSGEATTS